MNQIHDSVPKRSLNETLPSSVIDSIKTTHGQQQINLIIASISSDSFTLDNDKLIDLIYGKDSLEDFYIRILLSENPDSHQREDDNFKKLFAMKGWDGDDKSNFRNLVGALFIYLTTNITNTIQAIQILADSDSANYIAAFLPNSSNSDKIAKILLNPLKSWYKQKYPSVKDIFFIKLSDIAKINLH